MPTGKWITHRTAGAALPIIMLLLVGIAILSLSAGRVTGVQERLAGNSKRIQEAHRLSESGVENALSDIMSTTPSVTLPKTEITGWQDSFTAFSSGTLRYEAEIEQIQVSGKAYLTANNVPAYNITSEGESGPSGRRAERDVEVGVHFSYAQGGLWDYGIAGCDGVNVAGNTTSDSYSSSGNPADQDMGDIGTLNPDADITIATGAKIDGDVRATGDLTVENNAKVCKNAEANGNLALVGSAWVKNDANAGGNIVLDNKQTTDCTGAGLTESHSVGGDANAYGNITINSGKVIGTITAAGTITGGTGNANTAPPIDNPPVPISTCDPLDISTVMSQKNTDICTTNDNGGLSTNSPNCFNSGTKVFATGGACGAAATIGSAGLEKRYCLSQLTLASNTTVDIVGDVTIYVRGPSVTNLLELASNSKITLASGAKLTLYLDQAAACASNCDTKPQPGRIAIASNASFENTIPANLQIYSDYQSYVSSATGRIDCAQRSTPNYDGLEVQSNAGFVGVVYAPHACVRFNPTASGTFKGAVRGGVVQTNANVNFSYDEDLNDMWDGSGFGNGMTGPHLLYWREN